MAAKKKSQNRAQYERRSQRKRVLHWWLLLLILKYKRKNKIFLQISLLWCSWFRKIERIWNKEIPQRGGFCIGGKYRLPGIRGSFFEKNIIKKDGWPKCPPPPWKTELLVYFTDWLLQWTSFFQNPHFFNFFAPNSLHPTDLFRHFCKFIIFLFFASKKGLENEQKIRFFGSKIR